ncbi:MAG: HNH endonuclease, partial [Phycisphaerae bacterium]|nr:HNH endonuclease [Phycisphaerae bacterium]
MDWTERRDGTPIIRYTSLGTFTFEQDAEDELQRTKHQAEVSQRPGQVKFSAKIRKNYGGKCAVTGCGTSAALQAAHIKTSSGKDSNGPENGILLRSDIHALLDAYLITFNEAGTQLEASLTLKDKTYNFNNAKVAKPTVG